MRKFALLMGLCAPTLAAASVSVSAPANGSSVSPMVQYVASASSSCPGGVSAMGIYTAPNELVYTVQGAKLNTLLTLNPGLYHTVVEEWDNCGGASVTPVTITVGSGGGVSVIGPEEQQPGEFDGAICGIGEFFVREGRFRHGNLHRARPARLQNAGRPA